MKGGKGGSYHIGGITVSFPYEPYGSQLALMGRVVWALERGCHALLESPTGTGKSLSLLCSSLAWQQQHHQHHNPLSSSKPHPEAYVDPIRHGGGFVPQSNAPENPQPAPSTAKDKGSKKKIVPTIFYASRTHSQITQVVREYKKTTYRVPMAVLASKKHYCTNSNIRDNGNVDEDCKLMLRDKKNGCLQFKNVNKVKSHHSLQKGGLYEVHDIEDLLKVGHQMKGCSYFAARSMAEDAQLVFCPYSYIINPIIRKAMEVDIEKAIIILDEAHNIEDMARDAGSVDAEEDVLHKLQVELGQLACGNPTLYQPLHEMMGDLIEWMERRKDTLEKREFQHYFSCWTGDKALRELQEANISQLCFPILQDCATKAFKATLDAESEEAHLSPMSATTLEGLFSSLSYFFSENGAHINDYQLALQRYIKRDAPQVNDNQLISQPYNKRNSGNTASDWTYTFSLWSLNPAVVFKNIADLSLSVILTSGTLSPMNSFSSELGVQFGTSLEAPHIIDVESQLWAAVVSTGPGNYPLNASYKTADAYAFQDSLGQSLEEICKIVPGGSLIFFPSYKLMDKLCNRWRQTGQWSRLSAQKPLFVEPRGNQDEFEAALTGYYDAISGKKKPAAGRKRKGKKLGVKSCDTSSFVENNNNGAAFLAVCRGKISEGIDFSDDKARVVIIVGIPFPNINDIQVAQKKKYNDTFKSSRNLLTGNEWYCHQAFRALNQAAGRCIRHRYDYGAVIFLDERFCQERNNMYISKWLRKSMKQYNSFDQSLEELKSFFSEVKERLPKEAPNIAPNDGENVEKSFAIEQNKGIPRKKSPQVNKSHKLVQKLDSDCTMGSSPICVETYDARFTQSKYESKFNCPGEYIDLEYNSQQDLRSSLAPSEKIYYDDPDLTVVQETPDINVTHNLAYKDETSSSTITQCHTEFGGQFPSHTTSLTNTNVCPSKCTYSMTTPEKYGSVDTNCSLAESTLNLSVNSHTQKRRKSIGLTFANLIKEENLDSHSPSNPTNIGYTSSSMPSHGVQKFKFSNGFNSPSEKMSLDHVTNERLQICCSLCKKPLGLPENHFFVSCSIASSSKVYLTTLLKGRCEASPKSTPKMPVLICDISSVDHKLYNSRTHEGGPGQGIWHKEDGCVFNSVLCPNCMEPDNCLGVQIMATDAANLQLLDKVMFYRDRLEIMDLEASKGKEPEKKGLTQPVHVPEKRTYTSPVSIEDFAYVSKHQKSDGWRTTRSKMQLPKRGLLHTG